MARKRQYLDIDVLTAAKARLHHIYDLFDSVAVCFSGGKDSLATLHLTHEVAQERGLSQVNVVFRDEELIPDVVIDFVNSYRELQWVKMLYFAVPLHSTKYVLGRCYDYVQWDRNRRHLRPLPEHAITLPDGDARVFDQYTMDDYVASFLKGKVALVTGIRASESIIRYQASVRKLNDSYINATNSVRVSICKPLYDWEEDDIFRFFYEREIAYCQIYDQELFAGKNLRVSTPLHAEAAKQFSDLRAQDPEFYQRIVDIFPEMLLQDRYFKEMDREALKARYAQSLDGIYAFIMEEITDEQQQRLALERFTSLSKRHEKWPLSYPLNQIFNYFRAGSFKREMQPASTKKRTRKDVSNG